MGVFNHTCAITRTPLRDGAKCRVVVLASTGQADQAGKIPSAICGVGDIYKPVDRPFICTYNEDSRLPDFEEGHPDEVAFWGLLSRFGIRGGAEDAFRALVGYSENTFRGHQINYCFISEVVFEKLEGEFQRLYQLIDDHLIPFWQQKRSELESSAELPETIDEDERKYRSTLKRMHLDNPVFFYKDLIHFNSELRDLDLPDELVKFLGWGLVQSSTRHQLIPFADAGDHVPAQRLRDAAQIWVLSEYLQAIRGCWMNQAGQGSQDFNDSNQYELLVEMIQGSLRAQAFEDYDEGE